MDVLTIHIGHQKTGTTALQETFRRNADVLAGHGLYYYARFPTHHALRKPFDAADSAPMSSRRLTLFAEEMRDTECAQAFVSSETFTVLNRREVRSCIAYMRKLAPRVRVLAYVRDPVSYAISAVHQSVRQGKRLAAALETPSVLGIRGFVEAWSEAVGPENFTLKAFDRAQLVNGDIIDDVLAELGLGTAAADLARVRSNEALSVLGIHLLDRANAMTTEARLPYDVRSPYDRIRGPRFVPSAAFQERAWEKGAPVVRWLEDAYGLRLPSERREESPPLTLSEEELATLAETFYTMVRFAYDVRASTLGKVLNLQMPYATFPPRGGAKLRRKLQEMGVLAELRGGDKSEEPADADADELDADRDRLEA